MTSRHLIDQELIESLDAFPQIDFSGGALAQTRAIFRQMKELSIATMPPYPHIERSERRVPGPKSAPDVQVLIYQPRTARAYGPAYLHIHGGGYVMASAGMSAPSNFALANAVSCVVVSVDYRVAPETVFPGAVEDCYAGLKWLYNNANTLGVDENRIAIGGESAGGGLAAALALLTRDRGEVPIVHQHLVYPMIDDRAAADLHPYTGEFVWTRAHNHFGWKSLLGQEPGCGDISPYAAAARADNLVGLPPAFISTGALDLFLEENMEYARRLTRAGVPVELHVYPGAFHGFDTLAPDSRVGKAHCRDSFEALRHALERTSPHG